VLHPDGRLARLYNLAADGVNSLNGQDNRPTLPFQPTSRYGVNNRTR